MMLNRALLSNALRIYLVHILNEAEHSVHRAESQLFLYSYNSHIAEAWTEVIKSAQRLSTCILMCQSDDERGIHPYFVVGGLWAIDKSTECFRRTLYAAQNFSRQSFSDLKSQSKDAKYTAKFAIFAVVAERRGDSKLAATWQDAIAAELPQPLRLLGKTTRYSPQYVCNEKDVRNKLGVADAAEEKAAAARQDGHPDLSTAWIRVAHLTRMALATSFLPTARKAKLIFERLPYSKAARYAQQAAEYLAAGLRGDAHSAAVAVEARTQAALQYQRAYDILQEAVVLCLTLSIESASSAESPVEEQLHALHDEARRLHHEAAGFPQRYHDIDVLTTRHTEFQAYGQSCKHAGLAAVWTSLAQEYNRTAAMCKEVVAMQMAGQGGSSVSRTLDANAREQLSRCYLLHREVTALSQVVKQQQAYEAAAASAEASAAALGEPRYLTLRQECWRQAAHYLRRAIDAWVTMRNADGTLCLLLSRPPAADGRDEELSAKYLLQTCCTNVARYYAHIAGGILATAQEYHRNATAVPHVGVNPYWLSASEFLAKAAEAGMLQIHNLLAQEIIPGDMTSIASLREPNYMIPGFQSISMAEQVAERWVLAAEAQDELCRAQAAAAVVASSVQATSSASAFAAVHQMHRLRAAVLRAIIAFMELYSDAAEHATLHLLRSQELFRDLYDALLEAAALASEAPTLTAAANTEGIQKMLQEVKALLLTDVLVRADKMHNALARPCVGEEGLRVALQWRDALAHAMSALRHLQRGEHQLCDLYGHAGFYMAASAEACEAGARWDEEVLGYIAGHLASAAQISQQSGNLGVMRALHLGVAQMLREAAACVVDPFVPTTSTFPAVVIPPSPSAPLLPPIVSGDVPEDVHVYASDVAEALVKCANCVHQQAAHAPGSKASLLWEQAAHNASKLAEEQVQEVKELLQREVSLTQPSSRDGNILILRCLLDSQINFAFYASTAGSREEQQVCELWGKAISLRERALKESASDLRMHLCRNASRYAEAVTTKLNGEEELNAALLAATKAGDKHIAMLVSMIDQPAVQHDSHDYAGVAAASARSVSVALCRLREIEADVRMAMVECKKWRCTEASALFQSALVSIAAAMELTEAQRESKRSSRPLKAKDRNLPEQAQECEAGAIRLYNRGVRALREAAAAAVMLGVSGNVYL